jgi:hypothetical protein
VHSIALSFRFLALLLLLSWYDELKPQLFLSRKVLDKSCPLSAGLSTKIFGKNWQRLRQKPIQSRFQLFYFRVNIAFFRGSGDALS